MRSSKPRHSIAKLLRAEADPFAVQRLRRSLHQRQRRRRALRIAAGAAACSIVMGLLALSLRRPTPMEPSADALALEDGPLLHEGWRSPECSRQLAFNDGSSITLEAGASISIERSTSALVTVRLERGEAEFFVKPGGARMWRVVTEELTVTVLGTRFKVRNEPASSRVYVYRGKVMVEARKSGRSSVLVAGDDITAPSAPPTPTAPPSPPPAERKPKPLGRRPPRRPPLRRPPPERAATPRQLLDRSDEAKAAGDFAKAAALLEELLKTADRSEEAPYAAYSLGVLRMDMLDQPQAARAALERALRDPRLPVSLRRLTQDRLKKLR